MATARSGRAIWRVSSPPGVDSAARDASASAGYPAGMKAVVLEKQGEPGAVADIVAVRDDFDATSDPVAGEALVRTEASALNHMDLWVGMGVPGLELEYPRISGCDGCGVVEAVGEGVDKSWIGQRVIMNAALSIPQRAKPTDPPGATLAPEYELIGEHRFGTHREAFTAPVSNLRVVRDVDPKKAAAFGLVTLTAWGMIRKAGLHPGQRALITGIGGGVATAALSICLWMGCPVVVTSRHEWKLDRAKGLGAEEGVLDTGEDWSKQVRSWSHGRGVDLAIDSVGKPTHLACLKSLARGGAFVTCGTTAGPRAETDLARVFWNQLRVLGSTMGSNEEFGEVTALLRSGTLDPVIDSVHPWREAKTAWSRLEGADQLGKIVLDWS